MWHLPLIWLLEIEHASRTSRATRDVIRLSTDSETDFHQVLFKTVLCSALKLARIRNNYAVLMMFSTPSRSHQQSSISGCCAVFVWKSHPVCMTSASSDQEEASWGDMLALIPSKQDLFQKRAAAFHQLTPVNATCGQSPHLIWFLFQAWVPWPGLNSTAYRSCGDCRSTMNEMGKEKRCLHLNKREKQQKENSFDERKRRQTDALAHLCHRWDQDFSKLWRAVALGREREGGDDNFKCKTCSPGLLLPSQSPLCLCASMPLFSGTILASQAWMAVGHSHPLAGLSTLSSCAPGVKMVPKDVVVECQDT